MIFLALTSILIASGQDFEEIVFFPASLELLSMDTAFGRFLLLEEIEGHRA
jgi:hypothetical protein